MDEITSSPSDWPLPTGRAPSRRNPDNLIERTRQHHLAVLNQRLLFSKAELDVDSFRSILSEMENIKYGLDPRYQKAPTEVVTSPAVTSAFSEDGRSSDNNAAQGNGRKKWFKFLKASKLLQRLQFFRRRSRARNVARDVTDKPRNDTL